MARHKSSAGKGPALTCEVSGRQFGRDELTELRSLRAAVAARIRADHPELGSESLVSREVAAEYRNSYIEELLRREQADYVDLDNRIGLILAKEEALVPTVEDELLEKRTLSERVSDRLAAFGGSWMFLGLFAFVLGAWMAFNVWAASKDVFDPYPFILLNLVLSCIAAVQAPIIMMSQRRQEQKDRLRSLNDYRINVKAEREIKLLHEKLDHLITKQWHQLTEIQQLQADILQESHARKM